MRIITLTETGSTNAEARRWAESGDLGPLCIRAERQTDGRGRRGRAWLSYEGNLYASVLLPVNIEPRNLGWLSFLTAVTVHDCLGFFMGGQKPDLKWPNDVLVKGRKICGILLETGQTDGRSWCIIGIGINIEAHPDLPDYQATSIAQHVQHDPPSAHKILEVLLNQFNHAYKQLQKLGFPALRSAWLRRSSGIPGPVTVNLMQETFSGYAEDLGEQGELKVRLPDGTIRNVYAGEVYFNAGDG